MHLDKENNTTNTLTMKNKLRSHIIIRLDFWITFSNCCES